MRGRRLTEAMEHLYMEAYQNVKEGNEEVARRRLQVFNSLLLIK